MENNKLSIVHSNELIEASYSLTVDELRLLNLALTKIDSRKSNPGKIDVYPDEFAKRFNLSNRNIWRNMKNAVNEIMRKPISFNSLDENGKLKRINLSWLVMSEYYVDQNDGSKISIEFSPKLEPYIFDLKSKFTKINFEFAGLLTTSFSFRLYQWLIKVKNLDKSKEGFSFAVILDIDWMKETSGIKGQYGRWVDFKKFVIIPAIDQINAKTDISVIWKPIKQGRAVKSIQFNYVIETAAFAKPLRPRLHRRPKVIKGSHEEGSWMRKNLSLLLAYREELKLYDSAAKLNIKDLERIVEYSAICDHVMHKEALKELLARGGKIKAA